MHHDEVITRGHLPHWYVPGAAHFVTYRLADSLPADVIASLRARRDLLLKRPLSVGMTPAQRRLLVHKQLFAVFDRLLDADRSRDWLARPAIAALVRRNLYHHNGTKFHLLAYTIMPNHVHVLLQPVEASVGDAASVASEPVGEASDSDSPLAAIMHSLKSYTANEANALLRRSGPFWQRESYDHWARDNDELERIVNYINANPVKARLVRAAHEWFFGSAHDRYLYDGSRSGFLGGVSP